MERSFAAEVKQLALGSGQVLRGEGILAITKALLEAGVSYVGGYPGAPVSHLLDVLADANEPLLKPMGVYLDASANEAAAAALLGASINYPMRGAVTWKSIVGTNVAADALSNLASAGVIGGALIVVGEDYGAGASVIQERTHVFALKSSLCLFDPRPALGNLARMVEEGFGISEASNLPAVISLRIRAAHLRGSMVCKDNVRPRIGMLDRLARPSFDYARLSHPPSTYAQEAQKFERRLPAARRFVVERGLNEMIPGEDRDVGIVLQGGLAPTALRALELLGWADVFGKSRAPLLVLNVIHPLVPEQLLAFLEGKQRVLVLEEGMPSFIEQERRFDRIRRESGAGSGSAMVVTDYFKPDLDELYGILPVGIAGPIARWAERRWPNGRPTPGQHVKTTTVLGFLRVWVLGRLRFLRPHSLRFQRESALIARWERAVLEAASLDTELATEVADAATVVKGYGEVRRRLSAGFERLLDEVLAPALARDREQGQGYASATARVRAARQRMLEDDNGIEAAVVQAAGA